LNKIPVIDLFAGPGGLGEGFSSIMDKNGVRLFDIKLSIEKDEHAHRTLTWRSFFRQFRRRGKEVPPRYYKAMKINDLKKREHYIEKILNNEKSEEAKIARMEAQLIELGSKEWPEEKVDKIINNALGESPGNWVLIGGPPCQAYSNAGRSRVGGIDPEDHRVYLYREYLRIIKDHNPAVFVMENVKGLLSAKIGDEKVFDKMKKDLRLNGKYRIHSLVKPVEEDMDYLIKSEYYGVPQKRHRVILLGVHKDLNHAGQYLEGKDPVTLESIIGLMPSLRSGISKKFVGYHKTEKYKNGTPKRIYQNIEDNDKVWKKLMSSQIKKFQSWNNINLGELSNGIEIPSNGIGSEFEYVNDTINKMHPLRDWFLDDQLDGLPNHQSRSHMTQDLLRYMFASLYVEEHDAFPRLKDFAKHNNELIPDHANVRSGDFNDRFRVQIRNQPAATVTCHISRDGHYFIHYDPKQCRSLTVREAARIQTFPDNYLFRGSRTEQFRQVGNAVPPYLAKQIAEIVFGILEIN